jgi:hypothetical protein
VGRVWSDGTAVFARGSLSNEPPIAASIARTIVLS